MKRIACIVMTAMLLTIFSVSTVFATASDGFKLVDSNPEDGFAKVSTTNVLVKLFFSEDVSAADTQKANEKMFNITDADGKDVSFAIYYDSKDSTSVNLLVDKDLAMDTQYTVSIDGDMLSDDGSVLGADKTLEFSTQNGSGGFGYMILMLVMVVVMVVMTFRDQKKRMQEEQADAPIIAIQTNPYKLAKEKGISVDEAVKMIAAEKEKAAKKAEKIAKKKEIQAKLEGKVEKKPEKKVYNVNTKRVVKRK